MKSAEAVLCARLRSVYRHVMAESADLLVYFGDVFGEKLSSQPSTVNSLPPAKSLQIGN